MPVNICEIRDLLLPGLRSITGGYSEFPAMWEKLYEQTITAPHIWVPKLSIPQALVVGAAAAIIKNPVVTRRFWSLGKING